MKKKLGFCEKEIIDNKVRDHCHLIARPAHNICNINVEQKDGNLIEVILHNFSRYDCHLSFITLVDTNTDKVEFRVIPKTNEEYISIPYGCTKFIDSYLFWSSSFDKLVETLVNISHQSLKELKNGNVGEDNILNIVNEKEKLLSKGKSNSRIEKLKKKYPDKINELEEALLDYMEKNDLKILKTGFPDKLKY